MLHTRLLVTQFSVNYNKTHKWELKCDIKCDLYKIVQKFFNQKTEIVLLSFLNFAVF